MLSLPLTYVFVFIFGTLIGSFLNVVILRYRTGRSLAGRSMCPSCGKTLRWYELVPIVSFALQRGRCRGCGSKISWQYPLVELGTGALFVGIAYFALSTWGETVLFVLGALHLAVLMAFLVVIVVYDIRHKIIPNDFVYLFSGLALLYSFFFHTFVPNGTPLWSDLIAGPAFAFPFALLWAISGGRWMGLGDAKLALGLGWILGLSASIVAFLLAFWVGAVWSIAVVLLGMTGTLSEQRKLTLKSEIPFAPFLFVGFLITFFCGFNMASFLLFFG